MIAGRRAWSWAFSLLLLVWMPGACAIGAPAPTWVSSFSPGGMDLGEDVAIDGEGRALVVGIADNAGQQDFIVARLGAGGGLDWTDVIDEGESDRGEAVVALADGGFAVAGAVGGPTGDDVIVRRYGADGVAAWTTRLDKGTNEAARSLAVDPDGNLFVAGTSLTMYGGDAFVAKLSPGGEELWSRPVNLFFLDEGFAVAVGSDGAAVLAGRVLRGTDFDTLVRKFSAEGDVLWTRFLSEPGREELRGVAVGEGGSIVVAGTTTTRVGDASQTDVLVARYGSDGALAWRRAFDLDGSDDEGRDVALDASGNLLVTGFGEVDGSKDPFLLKLTPEGDEVWRHVWTHAGIDGTGGIATGAGTGRIVIGGAMQREGADFDFLVLAYDDPQPIAAFLMAGAAPRAGAPVAFEDASAPGRGAIVSWLWSFGDGGTSSEAYPSHEYAWGGEYLVRLTVEDESSNVATREMILAVEGPPQPPTVTPGAGQVPAARLEPGEGAAAGGESARSTPTASPLLALALAAIGVAVVRAVRGVRER